MHYLTNYYKNRCDQLQEQINHLVKLISETEEFVSRKPFTPPNEPPFKPQAPKVQISREPNLEDYQKLIKHLKSQGAPTSKIAEVETAMIAAGKRHGIDLEQPNAPWGKAPTSTAANAAKGIGAGVVGALAGEYIVKPAAEKLGVFDAVEKGTRAALSRMPDVAADVADVALGAAQVALDPVGSYNEFLANQARKSPKLTSKDREEAEARYNKQNF